MAAFPKLSSGSRASFGGGLPSGICNFKDLSSGNKAPTCGCRRFWLNRTREDGGERAWCFCGHHACFHNAFGSQLKTPDALELDFSTPPNIRALDRHAGTNIRTSGSEQQAASPLRQQPTGLGIEREQWSQSINFGLWDALNGFARQQEDGGYSDPSSRLLSTAVPSVTGDIPPSNLRTAGSTNNAGVSRQMGPPLGLPAGFSTRPGAEDYTGSVTEVATPSVQGTPDLQAYRAPGAQAGPTTVDRSSAPESNARSHGASGVQAPSPLQSQPVCPQLPTPAPTVFTPGYSPCEVQNMLQSYAHRLDVLENLSFNQLPIEEIQDRFEFHDNRLLELEGWHRDCEQREEANAEPTPEPRSQKRRQLPAKDMSLVSDGSFDSAAAAHTEAAVLATLAANAETVPCIDALEDRVADLESAAGPSYSRQWDIQVVLLPWGRDLRGIWYSSADATRQSQMQEVEEWVAGQAGPNTSFDSTGEDGAIWTTESIRAWASDAHDWLSPKACGPNTTVFQRLESRGLVHNISLTASDSGSILRAISSVFAPFLLKDTVSEGDKTRLYQGLKQPFIPLRKVRKSSRLRFLSPGEMITPAVWTAPFLDSSVFMKVHEGQRRLFITTPHAYEQQTETGLSWSSIRSLPIPSAEEEERAAQSSGRMVEACWTYNDKLDYPPSLHYSFVTRASHNSHWDLHSENSDPPASPTNESQHAFSSSSSSSSFSSSSSPRRLRHRTASLASSGYPSTSIPKRRIASFETTAPISSDPTRPTPAFGGTSKRRRLTTSPGPPSEPRGAFNLTPRRSREPPSPFTSDSNIPPATTGGEGRSSQGGPSSSTSRGLRQCERESARGTTPFAYATPHSNNHFAGTAGGVGFGAGAGAGEGDTEAGTEFDLDLRSTGGGFGSERGEEEWEGVGDDGGSDGGGEMDVDEDEDGSGSEELDVTG